MSMLPRPFVHDANQCLHVIRLAAEASRLEHAEGRLSADRLGRRLEVILDQVELLSALLERAERPEEKSPAPPAFPPEDHAVLAGARPQILLVDDEMLPLTVLADYLQDRGFDVQLASDGAEALECCHAQVFDAVVTDIRMPRLDGHQLVRALDTLQPGTPVIVVSGHITETDNTLFPANVRRILAKPFFPSRIEEELKALCAVAVPHPGGV